MDGVSGALAVASFSIQIVDNIQRFKRFLKKIQHASEELENLLDAVNQLESFLIAVNNFVTRQRNLNNLPSALSVIEDALTRCKATVEKLQILANSIEAYFKVKGRGRKVWASFKTVGRKEEVETLRKRVQEDRSNLQNALVLNASFLQLNQFEATANCHSKTMSEQRSESTIVTNTRDALSTMSPVARYACQALNLKETVALQYGGLLGKITLRIRIRSLDQGQTREAAIIQEKCVLISPSFLQMAFEVQYFGGLFGIPKSITVFPVVDHKDALFNLCRPNNFQSLKQSLSERKFSPFLRDTKGSSLLHYASLWRNSDLCSLLIQIGVDADHRDKNGWKALRWATLVRDPDIGILRTLTTSQDQLTSEDLDLVFGDWDNGSPERTAFFLSAYGISYEDHFLDSWDFHLLGKGLRRYGQGLTEWENLIKKWLHHGVDVHREVTDYYSHCEGSSLWEEKKRFTPLDELFALGSNQLAARSIGRNWLLMLNEAGYDLNAYLRKEEELHSFHNFLSFPKNGAQRQLQFEIGENPGVYWDWWVDPFSGAELVRHVFRHMNLCHRDYHLPHSSCKGSTSWKHTWPYEYPRWSENCKPYFLLAEHSLSAWKTWHLLADNFAKRHSRQARKKYPETVEDSENDDYGSTVPGAWIEDDS